MEPSAKRLRFAYEAVKRRSRIKEDIARRAVTVTHVIDSTIFVSIHTDENGQPDATSAPEDSPGARTTPASDIGTTVPPVNPVIPASTPQGNIFPIVISNETPIQSVVPVPNDPAVIPAGARPPSLPAPVPAPPPLQNTLGFIPPAQASDLGTPQITSFAIPPSTLATSTISDSQSSNSKSSGTASLPGLVGGNRSLTSSISSSSPPAAKVDAPSSSTNTKAPKVAGIVIGTIAAISITLLFLVIVCRCRRSRKRNKNYTKGGGESNANLAGATSVSPEGGQSIVTHQRGIVPSQQFFNHTAVMGQGEQHTDLHNQAASQGPGPNSGRFGAGMAAGAAAGAIGLAAMEHNRRGPYHRQYAAGSPIPEHPYDEERRRSSDARSVTSVYREDWPGPNAVGVEPLFHDENPPRAQTASPNLERGLNDDIQTSNGQFDRPISMWPGVAVPIAQSQGVDAMHRSTPMADVDAIHRSSPVPNIDTIHRSSPIPMQQMQHVDTIHRSSPMPNGDVMHRSSPMHQVGVLQRSNPMLQLDTQRIDEHREETIRPSPARTPQIRSAEIDAYPFPERTASPHSIEFPPRKAVPAPYTDHGIP